MNAVHCLIEISDAASPLTKDTSEDEFTIFQCASALTADLTGDCLVDLEDLSFLMNQWLRCGNPYDPQWCFQIK